MEEKQDTVNAFVEAPDKQAKPHVWPEGCPEPGFYEGVSYEDYASWKAVNASVLKIVANVTPKHAKAKLDGLMDKDTPDRKLGRGFHCGLLEPATFSQRFPVASGCVELLKSGPRKGEPCGASGSFWDHENNFWYCGTHAKGNTSLEQPDEFLSEEQFAAIESMRKEVFNHKVVKLVRQHGGCELSVVWARDGIPCKARIDKAILDKSCPDCLLDLKKMQVMAGTERTLQQAISNYGYDCQAAWYVDGVASLRIGKKAPLWAWIFVEDAYPFDVHPLWASRSMLDVGRAKNDRAWKLFRWCLENDTWPGYADDIYEVSPADWELRKYGLVSE